jgi:alkylation response protein AidB-like acyl-CoA dehydrogenase
MDVELDEEQLQLQRAVREVLERECPPALVRSAVDGADTDALWKLLVGMELPGLTVSADDGGQGASAVELVLVMEELGAVADPSPLFATAGMYVPLIRECAAAAPRRALLGAVCDGGTGAVVLEPNAVRARRDGDGWVLDGSASYVIDGDRADELAVVAADDDGTGVFVVAAEAVTTPRTPAFDGSLHVADVHLEGARVPAERAIVDAGVARGIARATEEGSTNLAAMTVGACRRILELVVQHVKARRQFGVPIGSFQAVKHMAVDAYVAIERARALVQFAALAVAEDDDRRTIAAAMAKAAAGDAQRITVKHGVQLFGGLGFTWENDLQIYVRRAKAGELLQGGSARHRADVARAVLAQQLETAR